MVRRGPGDEPPERPLPGTEPYPASDPVIDALLADMRELRLMLAADLAAAAAALDAKADRVAADIVDADRREIGDLLRRHRRRLAKAGRPEPALTAESAAPAAATDEPGTGWSRRRRLLMAVPAVPLAGALAASAAAAMGFFPSLGGTAAPSTTGTHAAPSPTTTPLQSSFHQFVSVLDGHPSESQLMAAARALHERLAAAVASGSVDAKGVTEVVRLLQMEQALLLRKRVPGSDIVLAASRRLAQRLRDVLPVVTATATPATTATPTQSPAVVPSPTATSTTSAVPKSPQPTHSRYSWNPTEPPANPSASPTSTAQPTATTSTPTMQIVSINN